MYEGFEACPCFLLRCILAIPPTHPTPPPTEGTLTSSEEAHCRPAFQEAVEALGRIVGLLQVAAIAVLAILL